jgi:hypothetical protein
MTWRHRALHSLRPFERDTRSKFVRMGSVNGQSVNSSPLKNPERPDLQGRSEQSKVFDFAGFGGAEVG